MLSKACPACLTVNTGCTIGWVDGLACARLPASRGYISRTLRKQGREIRCLKTTASACTASDPDRHKAEEAQEERTSRFWVSQFAIRAMRRKRFSVTQSWPRTVRGRNSSASCIVGARLAGIRICGRRASTPCSRCARTSLPACSEIALTLYR
jgi:hypothetical protein